MLPQLRALEEQFPDTLAVIGVHAAKFTTEGQLPNLRQAVLREEIRHPVLADPAYTVWDSYAVSAWPTMVIIDPEGRVVGGHAGEFEADAFAPLINELVTTFDRQGRINRDPLPLALEANREPQRPLAFPAKVLADAASGRLFIADTGHHRVLVADLTGKVQAVVGCGAPGLEDGALEHATFRSPKGLALRGDTLYVADTENHAIRRVDLGARRVERVAGTGEQARLSRKGGPALETLLNSPWDLALNDGTLTIAMAGNHQLWALDLNADEVRRFVGTGREALADGTLERCALAQPSGLALGDAHLYFADSESSAIRVADLLADRVQTIVGAGLFEFGDRDGVGPNARLQHALGVAYHDGLPYVADTYNHRIKRIDPATREARAFLGTGEAGLRDGPGTEARFWEPGGLSISGGRAYIADTNNHAIRVADLDTGEVSTLDIRGI